MTSFAINMFLELLLCLDDCSLVIGDDKGTACVVIKTSQSMIRQ
jgi:hypothetical protein